MSSRFFYGRVIVLVAGLCYGFGMSPMYYSWSMFAPRIIADLGIDRAGIGGVFGLFNVLYQCVGLLVGLAIVRFGLRSVMAAGFCTTAAGLLFLGRADTALDCYLGFSILGGIGIGFSTIIPAQTLGQNWFLSHRALVIGVIFAFGGIVGRLVAPADIWVLEHSDWRVGWTAIAAISMTLAVIAALLVRETPEVLGQRRDGADPDTPTAPLPAEQMASVADQWTAAQAIRTPQFALMLVCGVAYSVPWNTIVAHLTLHMMDVGHPEAVAIGFVGTMALISIGGRLMGAVGDWIPPQYALSVALALEGPRRRGAVAGRRYDTGHPGDRDDRPRVRGGVHQHPGGVLTFLRPGGLFCDHRDPDDDHRGVQRVGPWLAGLAWDAYGSYTVPFVGLMAVGLAGAAAAAAMRHPGAPPVSA